MARLLLLGTATALLWITSQPLLAQEGLMMRDPGLTRKPRAEARRALVPEPEAPVEKLWGLRYQGDLYLIDVYHPPRPFFARKNIAVIQERDENGDVVRVVDDGFEPELPPDESPVELPEAFFERYFFGHASTFEQWHDSMNRIAEKQLSRAEGRSKLSANEQRKLRLAAKGDIQRLADELATAKSRVAEASGDILTLQRVLNSYRPLRLKALSGPFVPGSLFEKTMEGIRRKQLEASDSAQEAPRASLWRRAALAILNVAFLPFQEPVPPDPQAIRLRIEDALLKKQDIVLMGRDGPIKIHPQMVMSMRHAIGMSKPEIIESVPIPLIDDFEADDALTVGNPEEAMPDGFIDLYFLFSPRHSKYFDDRCATSMSYVIKGKLDPESLSPVELKKLGLAAQGDLKRLDDDLANARNRLERVWGNEAARLIVLANLEDLRRRALGNLFPPNSFFYKTLQGICRKRAEAGDEKQLAPRAAFWKQAALAVLNIGFLWQQDPVSPNPAAIRQVIEDASRIVVIPPVGMEAVARQQLMERMNLRRQLAIDVELAMPLQKPRETNPVAAIDDFERDGPSPDEPDEEAVPESFIDTYFLGFPRDSKALIKRRERFLASELREYETFISLNEDDIKKLRLAALGDLKRLDDDLDVARTRLEEAWSNPTARMVALASFEKLRMRARSNPFQGNSFFGKTLTGIARRRSKADRVSPH